VGDAVELVVFCCGIGTYSPGSVESATGSCSSVRSSAAVQLRREHNSSMATAWAQLRHLDHPGDIIRDVREVLRSTWTAAEMLPY
jgi:hypothetical protein